MTNVQRLALCAAVIGAAVFLPHVPALAQTTPTGGVDTTTAPDFATGMCNMYPKIKAGAFGIAVIALVIGVVGLLIGGEDFAPVMRRVAFVMFALVVIGAAGWIAAQALGSSSTCTTSTGFLMDFAHSAIG
jgi:hypothetical protein